MVTEYFKISAQFRRRLYGGVHNFSAIFRFGICLFFVHDLVK